MNRFETEPPRTEMAVIALLKPGEKYIWIYNTIRRADVLRSLGQFASNPELSFTWYDAAVLGRRVREEDTEEA